jgi:phthiodiolone/phenolphthiodiolone dimycocerosates ketoreductase
LSVKFAIEHGTNSTFTRMNIETYLKSIHYANEMGYDGIFFMDHLNHSPPNAEIFSCSTLLGYAASVVKDAELGCSVTDPHRRHPSQIALDSLTIQKIINKDHILGLGIGEGMNLVEFGVPWNQPLKRLKEAVDVIKLLWKTSQSRKLTIDYSGEFFRLKNARLQIRIKSLPKLWIAANGPKMIEFTGEKADGWLPITPTLDLYKKGVEILKKSGRFDEITKASDIFVVVSDDNPDQAREIGCDVSAVFSLNPNVLNEYNITVPKELHYNRIFKVPTKELTPLLYKMRQYALENIPRNIIESSVIAGSSEDVIEQLNAFVKLGAEYFIIELFGLGDYFKALQLFTDKVFNYFKTSF